MSVKMAICHNQGYFHCLAQELPVEVFYISDFPRELKKNGSTMLNHMILMVN